MIRGVGGLMICNRREFIKNLACLGCAFVCPASLQAKPLKNPHLFEPGYLQLEARGEFKGRIAEAYEIFNECTLCPRQCGVNRTKGERGFCRAPDKLVMYSAHPHFGEELVLVGDYGSGTIFFSNCNLRCMFCQNWEIAHKGQGREVGDDYLAEAMLYLQKIGCRNINLVTPTHVMPNILNGVRIALQKGLRIPLVYNTSGYERVEIVRLLDGIVDIYMPDMKYMDSKMAGKYSSGADDYPEVAQEAVMEMNRQVGVLRSDDQGNALRGLIIRHLVMPNNVAGTRKFVKWVNENLPKRTFLNIMFQYYVAYRAFEFDEINRGITEKEYVDAMNWAGEYGLTNLEPRSVTVWRMYKKMLGYK